MATLRYFPPEGQPELLPIHKPVTTIGRALGNDVHLPDDSVSDHHAQIVFNGRDFQLEEVDRGADILINGKKKRRARLVNGDRVQLGRAQLGFSMFSEIMSAPEPDDRRSEGSGNVLASLRRLHNFSERLMTTSSVDELLEALLDDIIELTGAARGVVLLVDPGEGDSGTPRVRASRNVKREAIEDPSGAISDSIVRQVLESKRPVIVSDALTDTNFSKSESVIALKLSSVMCVPLLSQGEIIGVIYVGNDEVKHLFHREQLDLLTIFAGQASLMLQNAMLVSALRADQQKLKTELQDKRFGEIIGACTGMMEVFRKLQKVAATDISVLITGETGTGKELIARELHRRSNREKGPFIVVNCGAIPENLMESEMFGHVKGAFTGAVASRPGKFQLADGGTLFLDEIGELTLQLQVKLLRAIQERVVYRVGDSRPEKCDIRILAATNRNAGGHDQNRGVPGGSVLPPERGESVAAAPARPRGRRVHHRQGAAQQVRGRARQPGEGLFPGGAVGNQEVPLAGQHSPARKPHQEGARTVRQDLARARGHGPRARGPGAHRAARKGQGRLPAPLRARGARAQQRQPHPDRAGPGRRSANHLPLPRKRAEPDAQRRRRRSGGPRRVGSVPEQRQLQGNRARYQGFVFANTEGGAALQ